MLTGQSLERTEAVLDVDAGVNQAQLPVKPKQQGGWGTLDDFKTGALTNQRFDAIQQLKR